MKLYQFEYSLIWCHDTHHSGAKFSCIHYSNKQIPFSHLESLCWWFFIVVLSVIATLIWFSILIRSSKLKESEIPQPVSDASRSDGTQKHSHFKFKVNFSLAHCNVNFFMPVNNFQAYQATDKPGNSVKYGSSFQLKKMLYVWCAHIIQYLANTG